MRVFLTGYVEGVLSEIWNSSVTIKPKGKPLTKELYLDFECTEEVIVDFECTEEVKDPPPKPPASGREGKPTGDNKTGEGPKPPITIVLLDPNQNKADKELRAWRKKQAAAEGVPRYIVLNDNTIREIVIKRIVEKEQLLEVKGIAAKKHKLYGDPIVRITRKYFPYIE